MTHHVEEGVAEVTIRKEGNKVHENEESGQFVSVMIPEERLDHPRPQRGTFHHNLHRSLLRVSVITRSLCKCGNTDKDDRLRLQACTRHRCLSVHGPQTVADGSYKCTQYVTGNRVLFYVPHKKALLLSEV